MFGSPMDYLSPYTNILEPIYLPSIQETNCYQNNNLLFDSDPDCCHSSAPPTPDVISGLISLTGPQQYCSSEVSSGSFGDLTSTEEYQSTTSSPPAYPIDIPKVKATRTKLIKEGLKLTIQSRRIVHGLETVRPDYKPPPTEVLTQEDEERRRRRRERNKVAATKCRNKKKERTGRLAQESETLEVSNASLKGEIASLESEKKELMDLLQNHIPFCPLRNQHPPAYCSLPGQVQHSQTPSWSSVLG